VRGDAGRLYLSSTRRERMTAESWQAAAGARDALELPATGILTSRRGDWVCAPDACTWGSGTRAVVILRGRLDDDATCPQGQIVISLQPVPERCRHATKILDPGAMAGAGARTIWLGYPLIIRNDQAERGSRPWIPVNTGASVRRDDPAP
jgi:hypothetical protein